MRRARDDDDERATATVRVSVNGAPVDTSTFHLTGPTYTLDASPLARALAAALAVTREDDPRVQLEVHLGGLLIVGTDGYSLLTAWVPWPHGQGGWEATKAHGADRPPAGIEPEASYVVGDPEGDALRWATKYGKARRAKAVPEEVATIDLGTLDDGKPQPPLGDAVTPVGVRLAGPTSMEILPATIGGGIKWPEIATQAATGKPSSEPIPMLGARAVQLGRVANALGVDRVFYHQTRTLRPGAGPSAVTVVDFPGFPHVTGHIAAPRTP